jgi:integrating conjugative element relaxase (TIGR03760 family)
MAALAAGFLLVAAVLALWLIWASRHDAASHRAAEPAASVGDARALAASRPGWLQVLDAATLIQVCNLAGALQQIHRESKLSQAVWERDFAPAIGQYLRFVQLLPASEAHHHAHVGGLAAHTVEVVHAAITIRNGYLLPRGGAAELVDRQRDHWTYAVIFAALLHDIGKPMTDLRVVLAECADGPLRPWLPMAGDMVAAGAAEYEVRFAPKAERDYGAHRRLPLVLAPRIVPATALAFLAREPSVMLELQAVWSGDDATSVLTEIVRLADRRSAASNVQQGSRSQFGAATTVPLIEQLMAAMRRLLRQGGLPLNRDGAAGWVADGAIWFVAKRLADAVREEIARVDPGGGESLPGASKNDRLFDTWQDYGVLERNPDTGQAVWYVEVRGGSYAHELAMLRFPLDKLFDSPDAYPAAFEGTMVVKPPRNARDRREAGEGTEAWQGEALARDAEEAHHRPGKKSQRPDIPAPRPPHAASRPAEAADTKAPQRRPASPDPDPTEDEDEDGFLSDDDSVAAHDGSNLKSIPPISTVMTRPVTPFVREPTRSADTGRQREMGSQSPAPGDAALRFMTWLQQGLADGSIPYNEAGAPVHFVPEGMALVSPRTFRDFAALYGDDGSGPPHEPSGDKLGTGIQRHVIKARWHVVGSGNANVLHYTVLGRGGKPAGKLAAVVIKHPERWINPVPPANPNVVPFTQKTPPGAN